MSVGRRGWGTATALVLALGAMDAAAQNVPPGDPGPGGAASGPPVIINLPGPQTTTTTETYSAPTSLPSPGYDPNAHLGVSSRPVTDTSRGGGGFDIVAASGEAQRGGEDAAFIVEGSYVGDAHSVRRGDTLWDISGQYFKNPYAWPRIWAYNPEIQNPHWIYPGDRVRLRDPNRPTAAGQGGLGLRRRMVPQDAIFLREAGWIDNPANDTWGEVVGAPDDQLLLSDGDDLYIQIVGERNVQVGTELTLFRTLRKGPDGADIVSIRGTVRVNRYNPNTRMARARVVESLDYIERGAKVGPVRRRLDVVAPVTNDRDLEPRIITSLYPLQLYSQNQVVFLDKGSADGIVAGNRIFAVRRVDRFRQGLQGAGDLARSRMLLEDERPSRYENFDVDFDEEKFPDETYAELRVIRVREHTCAALITEAQHELERSARLVMRKGY